ncbi:MAG TPA: ferredoxin, partial [Gemmatimonadaceae bacterium]|nr:ferredoxin [Gemmatimonadaceae bacterium]
DFERKLQAVRAEYEAKLAALPRAVAHRMADALLRGGAGKSLADLIARITNAPANGNGKSTPVVGAPAPVASAPVQAAVRTAEVAAPVAVATATVAATATAPVAVTGTVVADDGLAIDPYIDSPRCTSCNECINLNGKLFGYNASKQAEITNADAGTFQQLVIAAERCPVGAIHPGTPRNPKERDLAKWLKRAEPFS